MTSQSSPTHTLSQLVSMLLLLSIVTTVIGGSEHTNYTNYGYNSLSGVGNSSSAINNTAIGQYAMSGTLAATADYNTAIGHSASYSHTSGKQNLAAGYRALYSNTTGGYNTASGSIALNSNIDGSYNAAFGHSSLYKNISGKYNSASGSYLSLIHI